MKMRHLAVATAAAFCLTAGSVRADHTWNDRFHYDRDARDVFAENELSVDLFGDYNAQQNKFSTVSASSLKHGKWGGGAGVSFFFTKMFGISADTHLEDDSGRLIDNVSGQAVLRFPIDSVHLAPYIFAGGGRDFEFGHNRWFQDAGAGLEFRLNHNTGIFADGRYVWVDKAQDYAMARAGLRVVFR